MRKNRSDLFSCSPQPSRRLSPRSADALLEFDAPHISEFYLRLPTTTGAPISVRTIGRNGDSARAATDHGYVPRPLRCQAGRSLQANLHPCANLELKAGEIFSIEEKS